MIPFRTQRVIEFSDTDMGGVVHFSRYVVFMETAEHQFLADRGVDVTIEDAGRTLSWPRVETSCRYIKPVRFGDTLDIEVEVARLGRRSVTYAFRFSRGDDAIAEGKMVAVCCAMDGEGRFTSVAIPAAVAARLAPAGGGPA